MRARARRGLFLSVLVLVGGLCSAQPASAGLTHNLLSSFGSFASVQGVAVDQTSGDVYVYDAGAGAVYKFDAAGAPAKFSALPGEPTVIEGVGAAGESENEIAVDNSAGPAKGDIYVANGAHVGIYSSAGASLGEITEEPGKPWGEPCGVAVDAAGNVYVGLYSEHVNKYTPAANPVVDGNYVSSLWGLGGVCNVAADSAGSVYVDLFNEGPIFKYEALQFSALEVPASGSQAAASGRAAAVDPATQDLYVSNSTEVAQFDPSGALIGSFGGGSGSFGNSHGVAVNGASGHVYVSDNEHARVDIFGAAVLAPDTVTAGATALTTTTATLHGSVNPLGIAVSTCEFEYGTTTTYGQTAACTSAPGTGSEPVEVSANIAGLQSNTTYYYRLKAANANGVSYGQSQQLLTLSPPLVQSQPPTHVSVSEATVNGAVNPMGFATSYHFEYGTDTSYGASVPVPAASAGAGTEYLGVSQSLVGLQPNTTYHYRLVASSPNGTTNGPDATFTTWPEPVSAAADACPNAALRVASLVTNLPDCRAYEMVSPLDKDGADIDGTKGGHTGIAAAGGERVSFTARAGFADTAGSGYLGGTQYVATRGPAGWSTRGVTPTPRLDAWQTLTGATRVFGFSSDLSQALVRAVDLPGVSNDVPNLEDLYSENTENRLLQAITMPLGTGPFNMQDLGESTVGYSSDLGVVAFDTPDSMLPQTDGLANGKLYAWERGTLKLAGILPDGTIPAGGSAAALSDVQRNETVSSDGSRVLFTSPADGSAAPQLYMRRNGTGTVWVSQSEASIPDLEPQNVVFRAASADGTKVLFTTTDRLTDSDPGGAELGLYLYSDSPNPAIESNLTFIGRIVSGGANRPGDLAPGMSDDGSHIYFSTFAAPGLQQGTYLWDNGTLHFVAAEIFTGEKQGERQLPPEEWRVSRDGRRFAFTSTKQLTSQTLGQASERVGNVSAMYLYDESSGSLKCVSCVPTGARTTTDVEVSPFATQAALVIKYPFRQRFMSSDGRYVFFSIGDALVPRDTNGLYDVYEYDTQTGKVALLSTGTGDNSAWFIDASENGSDAFLLTRQSLVPRDTDTLVDLYDARVDGGLPEPAPPLVPCAGDACQGTPSAAPSFTTASGFSGLGNQAAKPAVKATKQKAKPKKHAKSRKKAKSKQRGGRHKRGRQGSRSGKSAAHRARR